MYYHFTFSSNSVQADTNFVYSVKADSLKQYFVKQGLVSSLLKGGRKLSSPYYLDKLGGAF